MAGVSLNQLLSMPVVTRAISTIKTPQSRFQSFFGCGPGGANINPVGGHHAGYDIFDKTRTIAQGRAPGAGPGMISPQVISHVPLTIARFHEKMFLLEERIFRTRPLGKSWGNVDLRGQRYVTAQEAFMAQRIRNAREFMVSRMLRGGFDLLSSGDSWIPVDTGSGTVTISYNIPAANTLKFTDKMGTVSGGGDIITAKWATISTDIIGQLLQINAAFEQLHGRPLRHVWCNSTVLGSLLINTGLIAAGGTANTVFSDYRPSGFIGPDGVPDTGFEVVFRGVPWLRFHIYDAGLVVNGTYTKFLDNTHAVFLPDVDNDWFEMYEGSEIVAENLVDPGSEKFGIHAWTERTTQPAGFEMIVVDNAIPVLYVPKVVGYGTIDF